MESFQFDESRLRKVLSEGMAKMEVDVPCPVCGAKARVRGTEIAEQRDFVCSGCGNNVQLRDKDGEFGRLVRGE